MLGEIKENNKGTKMKIIAQRSTDDIDVEFLDDYHYVFKHNTYQNFKSGGIKNPFDKTVYGVGYLGDGKYNGWVNGKPTVEYYIWQQIICRCYNENDKETGEEHYYNPVPFSNASIIFGMGAYPFNGLASDNKGEFYIDLGNCVKGITKDDLGKYDWSIHVSDMEFDASSVKINNARMYIVSENKYINSDLQQPVTLDTTNTKVATKIIRFID